MYTDQYDLGMEYRGFANPDDTVVVQGDVAAREFIAYWVAHDGRPTAAMNVNIWDKNAEIMDTLEAGQPVR